MTRALGLIFAGSTFVLAPVACTGEDVLPSRASGADDGGVPPTDGGAVSPPRGTPRIFFHNQDVAPDKVEGNVLLSAADDEADVESYVVYFGASATSKTGDGAPLATFPKGAREHVLTFAPGTARPAGATHVLAYAKNAGGEAALPASAPVANVPSFVDLSGGITGVPATTLETDATAAVIDPTGTRALLFGINAPEQHTGAYVCNVDGTGCAYREVCNTENCARPPSATFGPTGKLVVVGLYNGGSNLVANTPWLYTCEADATGCTGGLNLAEGTGAGAGSGESPTVHVDEAALKLLVTTSSNEGGGRNGHALLFRSNLDGSQRTMRDLHMGYTGIGLDARSTLDRASGKLLVASRGSDDTVWITRCDLDGAGCVASPLAAKAKGFHLLVDTVAQKLLVTAVSVPEQKPVLFRCDVASSSCGTGAIALAPSEPANSAVHVSSALDPFNGKLLVLTENAASQNKLTLFRCERDGSACRRIDMSAGQGALSGRSPNALVDAKARFVLGLTSNGDRGDRGAMFRWGL